MSIVILEHIIKAEIPKEENMVNSRIARRLLSDICRRRGEVHTAKRASGGGHWHGEELPIFIRRD